MRLSTDPERDEARAMAVLHAAFDAGIELFDTADAYCRDEHDIGHNERLIARALAAWSGDRSRIVVATKGGLTRPRGQWVADGRARHLRAACEASRRALGVDCIQLYQLHAPDPRTPLSTSVRALAALQRDGWIASIGLCNVTVGQIEQARRIAEIAAVQVELSLWRDDNFLSGVAEYCATHQIPLLAYRPLGGVDRRHRVRTDPVLCGRAARHGVTPAEIALAWLRDLSPLIVPIPGATQIETPRAIARAHSIVLDDEDRAALDARCPAARVMRPRAVAPPPRSEPVDGEVVLIMGLPGAGKSTLAGTLAARGYVRLNRDAIGGSLRGLIPAMDAAIAAGASRIVLDNTYVSRKSRAAVVQAAASRGLPVRCLWLSTSLEDAQVNAATRVLRGGAPIAPSVQFRYQRELEPPDPGEGFSRIDRVSFARMHDPAFVNRALIVWCEGVIVRSRAGHRAPVSADDVEVIAERAATLRQFQQEGWRLLGMSWQPEIADGARTDADAIAIFARLQDQLGVPIEVEYCSHAAGPPACWCRKPLPGLGVTFIERHRLDPARCLYVGAGAQDPGFARRLGFEYCDADLFFAARSGAVE